MCHIAERVPFDVGKEELYGRLFFLSRMQSLKCKLFSNLITNATSEYALSKKKNVKKIKNKPLDDYKQSVKHTQKGWLNATPFLVCYWSGNKIHFN